jgi:hypothetical protein
MQRATKQQATQVEPRNTQQTMVLNNSVSNKIIEIIQNN